jgi:hypothetical protein
MPTIEEKLQTATHVILVQDGHTVILAKKHEVTPVHIENSSAVIVIHQNGEITIAKARFGVHLPDGTARFNGDGVVINPVNPRARPTES